MTRQATIYHVIRGREVIETDVHGLTEEADGTEDAAVLVRSGGDLLAVWVDGLGEGEYQIRAVVDGVEQVIETVEYDEFGDLAGHKLWIEV